MVGEGYGTTGINTGSAQVVGSPSFNIEKYAQPLIAKRKEDAAKAAAKSKSQERILGDIGKIKTIASPRYQPFIEQGKKDVLEKAEKAILTDDIYDKIALNDAQQKLNTMIDGAKKTDALYGNIGQQMLGGGNYWNKEYFDEYHKPLPTTDLSFDAFMKQATEDANRATNIRKDTYEPSKFRNDMESTSNEFLSKTEGFTENDLRGVLGAMFTTDLGTEDPYHFDAYKHFVLRAEKDKDLMAKYNGDIPKAAMELAVDDYRYLIRKNPPRGKSNFNFNFGGEDKENPVYAQYSEQEIPLGLKSADSEYPTPFKTYVIQLPTKGVELGGGLVSTDMYKVGANGETVQLRGQSAPTLSYTQIASLPIATKDTEVVDTKGNKFVIKKGQVVQPDYKAAAKAVNKVDIPTENKVMAIAVSNDGETYYRPAQDVARAIVNTFSGQKGLTYKGDVVFKDIKDYAKFLKENGVDVQGYEGETTTPQPSVKTTGGTKTIKVEQSRNFK